MNYAKKIQNIFLLNISSVNLSSLKISRYYFKMIDYRIDYNQLRNEVQYEN